MGDKHGSYSKGRSELRSRITRIPKSVLLQSVEEGDPAPSLAGVTSDEEVGVVFVSRATTSTIAGFFVFLLASTTYVGSSYFTTQRQVDLLKNHQHEMDLAIENLKSNNQALERKTVELQTQIENMRDVED